MEKIATRQREVFLCPKKPMGSLIPTPKGVGCVAPHFLFKEGVMKIFLVLFSVAFLIGCAGLNPYTTQLRDLHALHEQGQISTESYVAYKMQLTRQEFLWNQNFFGTLSELAEPAESKIIYIPPPPHSSLNRKKYTGTIEPGLEDQYRITIEEQP